MYSLFLSHSLYAFSAAAESDTYDPNDLGFLENNNSTVFSGGLKYIINKPVKNLLSQRYSLRFTNNYLYRPFAWTDLQINASAFALFKNFWDARIELQTQPLYFNDYFEARTPGIYLKRLPYAYIGTHGSSDSRKKLYFDWEAGFAESPFPNDLFTNIHLGFRYRFNDKFQMSTSLNDEHDRGKWAYSFRDSINSTGGIYNDPVIALSNVPTKNIVLSAQYGFTAKMNCNIRVRHNWTHVQNKAFYKIKQDGYWYDVPFVEGRDRNFNAFNIDFFYNWDFKRGSRITVGWKNALGNNTYFNPYNNTTYSKNLNNIFTNPHSNEVTLKVIYYLDYLSLKNRK